MKAGLIPLCVLLALPAACLTVPTTRPRPAELWIDLVSGEESHTPAVLDDLAGAGAVYVGETHTIARHHAVQLWLLQELFARGVPLVLCLEQLEAVDQPQVDRYARREIDFETLARDIDWATKWGNFRDYRALCEFARQHAIPIQALNAPAGVVRAISRGGGVEKLNREQRVQLPADLVLDAPLYEQVINLQLAAHSSMDRERLRPMFEAQLARDESMAANIVAARQREPGKPRTAFVILGAGHMRWGLGTPAGVRRRQPDIVERLVLVSESGQLRLGEAGPAGGRAITIPHAELRKLNRPVADYLRVLPRPAGELPPGHPPVSSR